MNMAPNFWDGGETLADESLLFIREAPGQRAAADCLFAPTEILGVRDPYKNLDFEAGRDFVAIPGTRRVELPEGSRIPFLNRSRLYSNKKHRMSYAHLEGHPETFMLFHNGPGLIRMQPELSYRFKNDWDGFRPAPQPDRLPATNAKLRDGAALRVTFMGDSITAGMHASAYFRVQPCRDAYPKRFVAHLRENWRSPITLTNLAVVGWTVGGGLERLSDKLMASRPDLAVIAYGMNDLGYRDPERFSRDTREMMRRFSQANSATEFILVAPMTGNPEWCHTSSPEMSVAYRDALRTLADQTGSALVDMTTPWLDMTKRKAWISLSGNGLNHPNDFGHQLYAERLRELFPSLP